MLAEVWLLSKRLPRFRELPSSIRHSNNQSRVGMADWCAKWLLLKEELLVDDVGRRGRWDGCADGAKVQEHSCREEAAFAVHIA